MTNTELAILAHRAGFGEKAENQIRIEDFVKLKQFAEAVAAKEREACAKIVEESSLPDRYSQECMPDIANAIRARGQA